MAAADSGAGMAYGSFTITGALRSADVRAVARPGSVIIAVLHASMNGT
jgi:phage-related baseplate assembly protein